MRELKAIEYLRINYPHWWGFGLHLGIGYAAINFLIFFINIVLFDFIFQFQQSTVIGITVLSNMGATLVYCIHWSYRQYRISASIDSFKRNFIFIGYTSLIQLLICGCLLLLSFFYEYTTRDMLFTIYYFLFFSLALIIPIIYSAISNSLKNIIVTICSFPIFLIIAFLIPLFLSILNIGMDVNFDKLMDANILIFICFVVPVLIIVAPIKKASETIRSLCYLFLGLAPLYTVVFFAYIGETFSFLHKIHYTMSIFLYTAIILATGYTKLKKAELYPKKY